MYFPLKCIYLPSLALLIFISHYIVPQSPGTCVTSLQLLPVPVTVYQIFRSVGVRSSCSHYIKSKWSGRMGSDLKVVHDKRCMYIIVSCILHFPIGNGSQLS